LHADKARGCCLVILFRDPAGIGLVSGLDMVVSAGMIGLDRRYLIGSFG